MKLRRPPGREAGGRAPQSAGPAHSVIQAGRSVAHLVWAMLAMLPLPAAADTALDARAQASSDGRVEIHNRVGSIDVEGWTRPEVEVTGRLGRGSERLDFNAEGGFVRIEVVVPPGDMVWVGASKLVVRVPSGSELEVVAGRGDVTVRGVTGPQTVQALNGKVTLSVEPGSNRPVDISSILGDVRLDIVGTPDAQFEFTTVSGEFKNCFGPRGPRDDGREGYRELRFTEGSGAGHVRIKTVGGDIRVCTEPP